MSEPRPFHQLAATRVFWIVIGMIALGNLLNAILNASLLQPWIANLSIVLIIVSWISAEVIVARRIKWLDTRGRPTKLRRLGPRERYGLLGCVLLLLLARFWPVRPTSEAQETAHNGEVAASHPDEAKKVFEEGITYLKSYDLPNAEHHFCRALRLDPKLLPARLYLARTWRDRGYDGAAAKEAQAILDMANKMKVDQSELKLYEAFGAEARGRWKEAIDDYRWLWDQKGINEFDFLVLVEALNLAGQSRLALETINEIRQRYVEEKVKLPTMDGVRLELERAIALMKSGIGDQLAAAQEAERVAREAKAKADEIDNTYLLARAQFVQCDALSIMQGDYLPVCRGALAGFQRQGDSVDVAKVYQVLGRNAATPQERLSYQLKALDIYNSTGFQRGISDVRGDISLLLSETGHESQAAQVCGVALDTARQIASLNLPEIRLNCTYYAKILDRDFAGAQKEAEEVVALTRKQGNRRLEAVALYDMAFAAHARGFHANALQLYREAMAIERELHDESWETILLYAWLLADLGRPSEARKELERTLKPFKMSERAQKAAYVVCWDRPILGQGTAEWLQMLKRTAGFNPKQCDASEEPVRPQLNFDSSLWAKIEVEEPHC